MAFPLLQIAAATAALLGPGSAGKAYDGAAGDLQVATPTVASAEIRIDGRLDDASWSHAALLTSFTQYDPVEGVPASQKTEVLVLVDKDAIYFGVRAFDSNPGGIRATMAQRDEIDRSDDYVRFVLDTFDDQRKAYVFSVNPLGVQHDGIWNEGSGGRHMGPPVDDNPNFLWASSGEITDWGYEIEVRIPLKSLRFPALPEQSWGLQVMRKISRNGYQESWAPISNNVANQLTQAGKLTGLKDLDPGLFMEINPVLTGKRIGTVDEDTDAFRRQSAEGDFGLNLTYGLTSNLTLDATYNPDFSQVEADAGQISVNERFGLFFPEKRPFFLEGTEIFNLPKNLVYTRSIANPIGGAKMTGKVGSWNVGYLGALDQSVEDGVDDAVANIIRVRRDLGASSTLGMVYTDRTAHADEYNRVAGVDARLVLARRYTITMLGSSSFTAEPDSATRMGGLWSTRIERAGRTFGFSAEIEDSNDGFDAGSGFIRRVGDTQLQSNVRYNWYGQPGALLENVGPNIEFKGYWNHDAFWNGAGPDETQFQFGGNLSFRGNVSIFTNAKVKSYSFAREGYDGFVTTSGQTDDDGMYRTFYPDQSLFRSMYGWDASLWMNTFERIRGNARIGWEQVPIFGSSNAAIEPAISWSSNVSLNLYPTRSLKGEIGLRRTTITRQSDGSEYSSATIPRVRAQYQFSRAFFVRGIFEYQSSQRGALRDPATGAVLTYCDSDAVCEARTGSDSYDFHVEGLMSYEPSPGTVFYIGYTRQMEDLEAFRFQNVRPLAEGLFVKLSYRFRM